MKKRNKMIIVTAILMLLILGIIGYLILNNKKEEVKEGPTNKIILKEIIKDNLKFDSIVITHDEISKINMNVTNIGTKESEIESLKIKLYNKEEELIKETTGYIGSKLKASEIKEIETEITYNLKDVAKMELEF